MSYGRYNRDVYIFNEFGLLADKGLLEQAQAKQTIFHFAAGLLIDSLDQQIKSL